MKIAVLKFGGTSMGSADSISKSARIVLNESNKHKIVVVVSAVSGVTNDLISLIDLAKKQKQRLIAGKLNRLEEKHKETLVALNSELNPENPEPGALNIELMEGGFDGATFLKSNSTRNKHIKVAWGYYHFQRKLVMKGLLTHAEGHWIIRSITIRSYKRYLKKVLI